MTVPVRTQLNCPALLTGRECLGRPLWAIRLLSQAQRWGGRGRMFWTRCSLEICNSCTFFLGVSPHFPSNTFSFLLFNPFTFMLVTFGTNQKRGLSRTRSSSIAYEWHSPVCALNYTLPQPVYMHLTPTCIMYRHSAFIFSSHLLIHKCTPLFHGVPGPPQKALRSRLTGTSFIRKDGCSLLKYLLSII